MPRTEPRTRCFKCGSSDHNTVQCNLDHRVCFNCRQPGHISKGCPRPKDVLNRTCGGCGQKGHISNDCSDRETWVCKNCAESGHGHWECLKPKGHRRKRCRACNGVGHKADRCTSRSRSSSGQPKDPPKATQHQSGEKQECELCGEEGHMRWQCFHKPCSSCGVIGHAAELCFSIPTWDQLGRTEASPQVDEEVPLAHKKGHPEGPPVPLYSERASPEVFPPFQTIPKQCRRCGSHQHDTQTCPIFQDKTNSTSPKSPRSDDNAKKYPPGTAKTAPPSRPSPEDRTKRVKAQRLWRQANELLCEDNHDRAMSLLAQALELEPSEPTYYITRAVIHIKCEEYTAALQDFETASTKASYVVDIDTLLRIARCRLFLGSPSSALLAVRNALALSPSDRQALLLRRRILDLESHIDAYKGAVSRNHWRMARSAYESCLTVYAQEDSDAPTHIRCWGIELLLVEGSWEDAAKSVDVLLREAPNTIDAMSLRSLVSFLQAKLAEAIVQILAALKLDPDNQRAKALRSRAKEVSRLKDSGNDSFRKGSWDEAMKSWTNALGLVGDREDEGHGGLIRATLLLNRATACHKVCKFAEGLKDVDESLKLRPSYFKAFLCRARILFGLELYETALEDYQAALEHGKAVLSCSDIRMIEDEVSSTEERIAEERKTEQDHYATLGLGQACTSADIKKAYRTLSLKHHPDKGGVAEKFKRLAHAYEVLSDPEQRRTYDARRERSKGAPSRSRECSSEYDDSYEGWW